MKQTPEKLLLVDTEINRTWIEKEKQLGDNLTKSRALSKILCDMLSSSKMIEL